jgi:hypothetical protein
VPKDHCCKNTTLKPKNGIPSPKTRQSISLPMISTSLSAVGHGSRIRYSISQTNVYRRVLCSLYYLYRIRIFHLRDHWHLCKPALLPCHAHQFLFNATDSLIYFIKKSVEPRNGHDARSDPKCTPIIIQQLEMGLQVVGSYMYHKS